MNYSQKMDPLFHLTAEAVHLQQQQQGNQHQSHFNSPTLVQNNLSRMTSAQGSSPTSTLNLMSYDRVPFPVVHSLMNPINDQ